MPRTTSSRAVWMDIIRGLAMLLVILGHSVEFPALYGYVLSHPLTSVGIPFRPFRMPALLVLSGLLLTKSLAKGLPRYYAGKIANIAWPFAVWLVLFFVLWGSPEILSLPLIWTDGSYLWFLVVVGICYLVGPLTRLIPPGLIVIGLLVMSQLVGDSFWIRQSYYGAFFFAGAWLATYSDSLVAIPRFVRWVCLGTAVTWSVYTTATHTHPHETVYGFALSCMGVLAAIVYFARARSTRAFGWLAWVGRHSIVFYVAHMPAILAVCLLVEPEEDVSTGVFVALSLLAGVLVPTVLALIRKPPVSWLFEMPLLVWAVDHLSARRSSRRGADVDAPASDKPGYPNVSSWRPVDARSEP